jgi:VIT1/CCC1 family predicted Fe2+/Mn2+ transporter
LRRASQALISVIIFKQGTLGSRSGATPALAEARLGARYGIMATQTAYCTYIQDTIMRSRKHERHKLEGLGWLRASVLGANDGIVSTSSLILGVAAAHATHGSILLSGTAGLVAGAMSMATGEYVSVHSQADSEAVALAQERAELEVDPVGERRELTEIYVHRGLEARLAKQVAEQLMAHDALAAHARDELGFSARSLARPLQAALASAGSFATGAGVPLLAAALASPAYVIPLTVCISLLCLFFLGALSAAAGGANLMSAALRVTAWSALAMGVTAAVGTLVGSIA